MGDSNHYRLREGRDEQNGVSFHPSENVFASLLFNNARTSWSYPAIWAYYSLGEADLSGESDESRL